MGIDIAIIDESELLHIETIKNITQPYGIYLNNNNHDINQLNLSILYDHPVVKIWVPSQVRLFRNYIRDNNLGESHELLSLFNKLVIFNLSIMIF